MTTPFGNKRPAVVGFLIPILTVLTVGCTNPPQAPQLRSQPQPTSPQIKTQQTGCTAEQRMEKLRASQTQVFEIAPHELGSLDEAIQPGGPLAGWRLSHGQVVLASAGGVAVDNVKATHPVPQLLVYAPSPSSSPSDWLDVDKPDGPYRLIGWAYIVPYELGSEPPSRPCIAAREWLIHEAGWHLMDGGMLLTPGAISEPPRPDVAVHFWHPRVWDLHVWAGDNGVPTISYANPRAREGGVELPEGAFLHRVKGRWRPIAAH